jgi:hypothetical protein
MITLGGTFKACESCDQTRRMITLGGTFKACESCDQTRRMITLGGTFKSVRIMRSNKAHDHAWRNVQSV